LQTLADQLGIKDKIDNQLLRKQKDALIKEIYKRARDLREWQQAVNPLTGELSDSIRNENRVMQKYNEEMAKATAKTPADIFTEQTAELDNLFKQAKSLPDWENTEFGKKTINQLEKIETEHKEIMEKADAFEKGAKQAFTCGLQGELE